VIGPKISLCLLKSGLSLINIRKLGGVSPVSKIQYRHNIAVLHWQAKGDRRIAAGWTDVEAQQH
jgi:hypothetical protein